MKIKQQESPNQLEVEGLLYQLYKETHRHKKPGKIIRGSILYLGELEEEIETKEGTKALYYLEKKGIIEKYVDNNNEIVECGDKDDGLEDFMVVGHPPIDYWEIARVKCDFYPEKVKNKLETLWNPKKEISKKLADNFLYLKEMIESLFNDKAIGKDPLIMNKAYKEISDNILKYINLLRPQLIRYSAVLFDPDSLLKFKKPFRNLYSAKKELEERKISHSNVYADLDSFYGKARELEDFFSVKSLLELRKAKEKSKAVIENLRRGGELITLDERGSFYYNDHKTGNSYLIELDAKTLHYAILKILYENGSMVTVPYEVIEEGLKKKFGGKINDSEMVKRINNAVINEHQGLQKQKLARGSSTQ